mmetsp:Transcript_42262/g.91735  ORF Transcript_42262/g.91735 Transcript_42262/m.91735 type:complete len:233 (-) Transcript_42262:509-1207(-)
MMPLVALQLHMLGSCWAVQEPPLCRQCMKSQLTLLSRWCILSQNQLVRVFCAAAGETRATAPERRRRLGLGPGGEAHSKLRHVESSTIRGQNPLDVVDSQSAPFSPPILFRFRGDGSCPCYFSFGSGGPSSASHHGTQHPCGWPPLTPLEIHGDVEDMFAGHHGHHQKSLGSLGSASQCALPRLSDLYAHHGRPFHAPHFDDFAHFDDFGCGVRPPFRFHLSARRSMRTPHR